jgi:hypothetical protein
VSAFGGIKWDKTVAGTALPEGIFRYAGEGDIAFRALVRIKRNNGATRTAFTSGNVICLLFSHWHTYSTDNINGYNDS